MGVSGRRILILILIVIAAVAVACYILFGAKKTDILDAKDIKFIDVYSEMSVAREMAGDDTIYLDSIYSEIYKRYDVDFSWIVNYVAGVSGDAGKQKRIWDDIVARLDSLKSLPDSLQFH